MKRLTKKVLKEIIEHQESVIRAQEYNIEEKLVLLTRLINENAELKQKRQKP
jgi:hypothetical protein